jgi:hypothetical protein
MVLASLSETYSSPAGAVLLEIGVRLACCRLEAAVNGSAARPDAYVNRQYQYARRPAPERALVRLVG